MVTHDPKTTAWCDTVLHLEKGRLAESDFNDSTETNSHDEVISETAS
jgi:ABC-type transport system involved in cytochrome bd biosynthesis fused ATPase/permease subunit